MDLVKTLLVYMAVLLTSSTAFTPALTPPPAGMATATPYVSQTPAWVPPLQTPTATPAPTATPVLTLLSKGSQGEQVRVMQVRLKELGYLTGNVDGIFGNETLRAVERFQSYNNLKVDGIAGRNTLNKLYYDRNVVYAPVDITPPPTRKPAATANVPIYYRSNDGKQLFTEVVTLSEGRTTLRANAARVPQGYVLTGASQVMVTVSSNGTPSPASVIFTYYLPATTPPATAMVTVNYLDESNVRLNTQMLSLTQGHNTVTADDRLVPAGYTLTSVRSVQVRVSSSGVATPSTLSFVYRKAAVTVMVPVNYVDTGGITLYSDQINLTTGAHPVIANDGNVPDGYTLQGANTQTVNVDAQGNATPPSITFVYAPPAQADVPVYYRDTQGKSLHEEVQRLAQGLNTVTVNQALAPQGYALQGPGVYTVQVDNRGLASPAEVIFTFQAPAAPTDAPTDVPTDVPTDAPTDAPTDTPTDAPTDTPTDTPTDAPTDAPTEAPLPVPHLPEYQTLSFKDGVYPVYTGPGEHYYRVENATLGGGVCRLYGYTGDWLLIGYGTTDGGYRIGFITSQALPDNITTQELALSTRQETLARAVKINDDPIINPKPFAELGKGTVITVLAFISDNPRYVYIEVPDFRDGQPARGFILAENLP